MTTYRVWYKTRATWEAYPPIIPTIAKLAETHTFLRTVEIAGIDIVDENPEEGLDLVWTQMQGENWSPNGEARPLIEEKGLCHTSMSTGDVIEHDGKFWAVAPFGFKELAAG